MSSYPRLTLLGLSFLTASLLYQWGVFDELQYVFHGRGYISMFLGGLLFSFGFTSAFGVAIFIAMADEVHPGVGAIVATTAGEVDGCGIDFATGF